MLGSDTMAQYNKLFGSAPPMGVPPSTQFDPVQVAAANGDALQAASKGATSMSSVLNDADGYPFCNNENAVLVATGVTHHIVLLLKK